MEETEVWEEEEFPHPILWWTFVDKADEWNEKVETIRPFVERWCRVMNPGPAVVPECWDKHEPIVALLGWLYDVASSVEDPAAMPIQSRDVADVWLRTIKPELQAATRATGGCDTGSHRDRPGIAWYYQIRANDK